MATTTAAVTSHFFRAQFRTQKPSFGFQAKLGGFGGFSFGKKSSLPSPHLAWQGIGKPTHHLRATKQEAGPGSEGYAPPPKESWPELLGAQGTVAKEIIESENPNLNVVILLEGSPATTDFQFNRVRIVVNTEGIVTRVPTIG